MSARNRPSWWSGAWGWLLAVGCGWPWGVFPGGLLALIAGPALAQEATPALLDHQAALDLNTGATACATVLSLPIHAAATT